MKKNIEVSIKRISGISNKTDNKSIISETWVAYTNEMNELGLMLKSDYENQKLAKKIKEDSPKFRSNIEIFVSYPSFINEGVFPGLDGSGRWFLNSCEYIKYRIEKEMTKQKLVYNMYTNGIKAIMPDYAW